MEMVKCKKCGKLNYHYSKGYCKSCYFHQYNESRKNKMKEYNKKYYSENKEKSKISCKEWRKNHIQERRDYLNNWRKNNPNYNLNWCKSHREESRKIARESDRRRRANKHNSIIEPVNEDKIYERDNYRCVYCGSKDNLTLDHIIPINNNGSHNVDNLVVACLSCNCSKQDKPLQEWLRIKFGKDEIPFQTTIRKINKYYSFT